MAGNPKQKLKLLYLADYLRRYSNPEHPAQVSDIIAYLARQGVSAERKSIYNDVDILREYGMPVEKGTVPTRGYYLADREFETSELMILADAVQASPVISKKKTQAIINKLKGLTNVHEAKMLTQKGNVVKSDGSSIKTDNEEFYYNVDTIHNAIATKKKIRFIYHRRVLVNNIPVFDTGREFVISPYAAMWNQDKYYVIGNYDKYDDLSHYRIDRMKKVTCTNQPIRRLSEVSNYRDTFDTADYAKKVFNMFAGDEPCYVELEFDSVLLEA
ncbi:MAG: WYL domain-containing protein [Clostridia bacterium]|nr:WYL domain-containing protein [Clostridia bacterium]